MKKYRLAIGVAALLTLIGIACNTAPPSTAPLPVSKVRKFAGDESPDKMASHTSPVPQPKR